MREIPLSEAKTATQTHNAAATNNTPSTEKIAMKARLVPRSLIGEMESVERWNVKSEIDSRIADGWHRAMRRRAKAELL